MISNKEGEHIKTALRELDVILVNGLPMVSLKSVLRILTGYRKNNDNWDLLVCYKDEDRGTICWIGPYNDVEKAKKAYEAELEAKQTVKKLEDAKKKQEKQSFLSKLFRRKS